jgi:hypothetical protein
LVKKGNPFKFFGYNSIILKREKMKKAKRVEFGIEITKPWSAEMYNHNEQVADEVRGQLADILNALIAKVDVTDYWGLVEPAFIQLQKAVTCYGFADSYLIEEVVERIEVELKDAPLYRLNEIAEELGLELEKGFVGFN